MYLSDGSAAQYKNRKKNQHLTMNMILISLLNGTSSQQAMGRGTGWKGWLQRQVYRKCTVIKFKHLINCSVTAVAVYTTLHSFMSKKNKFLTGRRNLQNDFISQLQYQELKLVIVSNH
jgi:hypothetical protein